MIIFFVNNYQLHGHASFDLHLVVKLSMLKISLNDYFFADGYWLRVIRNELRQRDNIRKKRSTDRDYLLCLKSFPVCGQIGGVMSLEWDSSIYKFQDDLNTQHMFVILSISDRGRLSAVDKLRLKWSLKTNSANR